MFKNDLIRWVIFNISLALTPVVLAQIISLAARLWQRHAWIKLPAAIIALVWLVFLPNTCYLLTEWRHFLDTIDRTDLYMKSRSDSSATIRIMLYTVFYFCYSAFGMLAFALAIRPIERIIRREGGSVWVWGAPLFLLTSIGVYLGLVLRFNSWELITRPQAIWFSTTEIMLRPTLSAFIVIFAVILWLSYYALDIWIDGFISRWRQVFGFKEQAEA